MGSKELLRRWPRGETDLEEASPVISTILGARLRWRQPNGWLFEPVMVGPDTIDYTVREGPHVGRHAIQGTYYHRIAPGIELTSWYEEVGTIVNVVWYLESQTTHRFAAIPAWAARDITVLAHDNQDPGYLERVGDLAAKGRTGRA
jgi:phenolic acid decarboxylase